MALVYFSSTLSADPGLPGPDLPGEGIEIEASTVRALIRVLDERYPGAGEKLSSGVAVAIDGEIHSDAMLEKLSTDSEVHFIPAIEGG